MSSWAQRDLGSPFLGRKLPAARKQKQVTMGHRAASCDLSTSGLPPSLKLYNPEGLDKCIWLTIGLKQRNKWEEWKRRECGCCLENEPNSWRYSLCYRLPSLIHVSIILTVL